MKITYRTNFSFGIIDGLSAEAINNVCDSMPPIKSNVEIDGSIEMTPEEYQACLTATIQAAKEAADVWRPVAVQIVKDVFGPKSFKEFCEQLWASGKAILVNPHAN